MNDDVLTPANTTSTTTSENTNEKHPSTTTGSPSHSNAKTSSNYHRSSSDSHTLLKLQDALNDELVSKTTNRSRQYPSQFELSVNDSQRGLRFEQVYEKGPLLGEGGFAFVYRCKHKQNQYWYAVKEVDVDVYEGSDLKTEIAVMKALFDSPYMVRLHDVFLEPHFTYLVMEEVKGGDLLDALERKQTYSVREARKVSRTLLEAVAWCHKKRIAHRDIKPENILLMHKGDDTSIKLCDFGCAKFFQPDTTAYNSFHTMVGSPQYVAPEIYLADLQVGYGPQCDLWSTGVVIYVLLGGYCPFDADNPFDLSKYICEGYFKFHSKYWNHVPDAPRELIKHLLVVDPVQRWNSKQALDCTWLRRPQLKRFGSDPRVNSVGRTSKKSSLETTPSEAVIDGSACTVIHSPDPTKDPPGALPVMSSPAATPARLVKHYNESVRPEESDDTKQETKLEKEDFVENVLMPFDVEKSKDNVENGAGSREMRLSQKQEAGTLLTTARDAVDQIKRESTSSTVTDPTVNSIDDEAVAVAPDGSSLSMKLPVGDDGGQSVVENKLPPPPEHESNETPESPTKFLRKVAQEDQPRYPSSPRPPLKQPWHISLMDIGVSDHSITELMHESSHSNTENSNDSSESDDFASKVPMFTWKRSTGSSPSPWEGKSGLADSTTLKKMQKQHKNNHRGSGKKKKDRLSRYANSESVLKIPKDLITVDEATAEEESGGGLDGKSTHSLARRYSLTDLEDHDLPETLEPLPGIPMMWLESFPRVIRREVQASTRPRRPSVLAHM